MQQWSPDRGDEGDASLYGALLGRVKAVGGHIAGVLWYQGESDIFPVDHLPYPERMRALVAALRRDCGQADLPFYFVQLGRIVVPGPDGYETWSVLREYQRLLGQTISHAGMVPAIDLGLDDLIHIDTAGLRRLGRRLARLAAGHVGLDLDGVTYDATQRIMQVTVRHVAGELQALGRPAGFSLHDAAGDLIDIIYKVTLAGNIATLHLTEEPLPHAATLTYGWGHNPYCNIIDSEDMALPAFGPHLVPPPVGA